MLESNRTERARATDTPSIARALQDARIGIWVWDIQSNNVYFSPEWKRQLGYEDHELKSRFGEFEDRLHPQDRNSALAALKAYVEGRRPDYEVEFRLRHKNGTYRWIFSHAFVQTGTDGKPCRVSGCHLDITDRKEAEKDRGTASCWGAEPLPWKLIQRSSNSAIFLKVSAMVLWLWIKPGTTPT